MTFVDDHAMLRYDMVVNLQPDMEVVADAGDHDSALAILTVGFHCNIVLIDVTLKPSSGFGVIRMTHTRMPALPCSLRPYMTKRCMPSELCGRVRELM